MLKRIKLNIFVKNWHNIFSVKYFIKYTGTPGPNELKK